MLKLNCIVALPVSSRIGVVVEFFEIGRRKLACVHYIDTNTGKPMTCPDSRCDSTGHTCPIHSSNTDVGDLTPFSNSDVAFYVTEGMISPELARKHSAPAIRISRRTGHRYNIETLEEGFVTRKVEVSPMYGRTRDEWQI